MILLQQEECHGVEIMQQYEEVLQQSISLPAIHVVLKRMEKKAGLSQNSESLQLSVVAAESAYTQLHKLVIMQ